MAARQLQISRRILANHTNLLQFYLLLNILPKRYLILLIVQIFNRLTTLSYIVFTLGLSSAAIFNAAFDDLNETD